MLELSEIKKDLQSKEDLVKALQSEALKLQYAHLSNKQYSGDWQIILWKINILLLNIHPSYMWLIVEYVMVHRSQDEQHTQEVSKFQEELAEAHAQLQILQKQLDEELAKQPLTNQEVRRLNRSLKYLADLLYLNSLTKRSHDNSPLLF